jgi:hypothetical protein
MGRAADQLRTSLGRNSAAITFKAKAGNAFEIERNEGEQLNLVLE